MDTLKFKYNFAKVICKAATRETIFIAIIERFKFRKRLFCRSYPPTN